MNPRLFFYRIFAGALCRIFRRPLAPGLGITVSATEPAGKLWFHAASVGELEGLLPIIQECAAHDAVCAVSVWSHSGDQALLRLQSELGVSVLRAPHEGSWSKEFAKVKPRAVISYRYEAWPDLWAACSLQGIPILLIGARVRPSLRWLVIFLKLLGVVLPRWSGTVFSVTERSKLISTFPLSQFFDSPNPRWQRAAARVTGALRGSAEAVGQRIARLPHPVLFLSQVWESDFDALGLDLSLWKGGIVVIPHSLEPPMIKMLGERLLAQGMSIEVTRGAPPAEAKNRAIIVNEHGILNELYRFADFAYVGGGFERGIHSVIEPACAGIRVACGPLRVEDFEEVQILEQLGTLTVLRRPGDWMLCMETWVDKARQPREQLRVSEKLLPAGEAYWWRFLQSQAFVD